MQNVDLKKYIGRDYESYNCLDLVREFYKDYFSLEIQNYYEGGVPDRREVEALIKTNKGSFVKVQGPTKFGDIVIIKLYGLECHIGVVVEGTKFLHSARGIGSNMDRLERYSKLIAGFYRHKELT